MKNLDEPPSKFLRQKEKKKKVQALKLNNSKKEKKEKELMEPQDIDKNTSNDSLEELTTKLKFQENTPKSIVEKVKDSLYEEVKDNMLYSSFKEGYLKFNDLTKDEKEYSTAKNNEIEYKIQKISSLDEEEDTDELIYIKFNQKI